MQETHKTNVGQGRGIQIGPREAAGNELHTKQRVLGLTVVALVAGAVFVTRISRYIHGRYCLFGVAELLDVVAAIIAIVWIVKLIRSSWHIAFFRLVGMFVPIALLTIGCLAFFPLSDAMFERGLYARMQSRADIGAIRDWIEELETSELADGPISEAVWPTCVKRIGPGSVDYVRGKGIVIVSGYGFLHCYGLVVMLELASTPVSRQHYRYVGPGAYVDTCLPPMPHIALAP